jgi:polar amino acid transport system substrate-binding protein
MKFSILNPTKIILLFGILISCFFASSCSSDKNKITFAVSAKIYPFEFYENNELAGFDIELGKLIAKELGKEAVFKDMYYYNIFTSLQNDHVDASISSHIFTKKRATQFLFSKIYQKSEPTFVFNSKFNNFSKISDLNGKKISPFYGSMFNKWFEENLSNIQKIYYSDELSAVKALENGSVDLLLIDKFEALYLKRKDPNIKIVKFQNKIKFYVNDKEDSDLGFGIIVKKKNAELLRKINLALEKLEKEGKIIELSKKFLIE